MFFMECKIIFKPKPKHTQTRGQQVWLSPWKGKMPACFHSNMPAHVHGDVAATWSSSMKLQKKKELFLPLLFIISHVETLTQQQAKQIHPQKQNSFKCFHKNNSRNKGTKTNVPNKQHCLLIFLHYCQVSGQSFLCIFFPVIFICQTLTEGSQLTFAFGREKLYRTWSLHFSRVLLSCCKIWWVKTPFLHPHFFWQS